MSVPDPLSRPTLAPLLMGIVNVTPDSFSDGGRFAGASAIEHARRLVDEGCDILDIGGESTRPGALPVPEDIELARVLPVIEALRRAGVTTPISVDTMKAGVARRALDAGADIVNDVSAGRHDAGMFGLCAARRCPLVLMHMRGEPRTMQDDPRYDDVTSEVRAWLLARVEAAMAAGCEPGLLWLDAGFGFGKLPAHNAALVKDLASLASTGHPVVLGLSRKSSLAVFSGEPGRPAAQREAESLAGSLVGALKGAHVLRVHDVGATRRALGVLRALW